MANDRGGLQPTPEDQAQDAWGVHKDDVEVRIAQLEKTLAKKLISKPTLRTRMEKLEIASIEFEAQYNRLLTIAGQGRLQGLQAYHATLQHHYLEVHAGAEDALNDDKHRSGSRNCSNPPRKPRRNWLARIGVAAASSQV